jgi:penicillin amidase
MILRIFGFLNPSAVNQNGTIQQNNQPEAIDGFVYPGYYLPEDRAKNYSY